MAGINVSGSSSYHASRPNYMRVGSGGFMELKAPTTTRVPNEVVAFNGVDKNEEEQRRLYAGARAAVEGIMAFDLGRGSLFIEPGGRDGSRKASLSWKDENGAEQTTEFTITDDTRISWDDKGAPIILQGARALDKGVLKAKGANEFLIRVNASLVEGGDDKTGLLNLSESAAAFVGGKGGMTFWGSYKDSTIVGGEGQNSFVGVFTGSTITGGASNDTFSGFFAESMVTGGKGDDTFSGIFFDKTEVSGEDGDDSFSGRFVSVKLYGGKGKNFFGHRGGLLMGAEAPPDASLEDRLATFLKLHPNNTDTPYLQSGAALLNRGDVKASAANQFVNVTIDAGEEDTELAGSFNKAEISLGKGKNTVTGFAVDAKIDGSRADRNEVRLGFANNSTVLSGAGDDTIDMVTGRHTRIGAGAGNDAIGLGDPGNQGGNTMRLGGVQWDLNFTEFSIDPETGNVSGTADRRNFTHGTLEYNVVNAAQGRNTVGVNTRDENESFLSGDKVKEKAGEEEKTEETENAPATPAEQAREIAEAALEAATEETGETDASETETPEAGDISWDNGRNNHDGSGSTGAVQVIMNHGERRVFNQSYGSREARQRTFTNFASSNPGAWTA